MSLAAALGALEQLPEPMLVVLAGSNGAGKSTFHRRYLQHRGHAFINADNIAKALYGDEAGARAYGAMHIAEAMRQDHLKLGYSLVVIFIRLGDPLLSMARVSQRVAEGGHDVPAHKIIERFPRTLANAQKALRMANVGVLLENSDPGNPYQLVELWQEGRRIEL